MIPYQDHATMTAQRRNAFEAQARAARLAAQVRPQRHTAAPTRGRAAPRFVPDWWRSVRLRRQLTLLERAVAGSDQQAMMRDYVDCR